MKNPVDSVPPSRKRGKREVNSTLPEDILIDILSRLPAKYVLRYQCVCWRWRNLISTKEFADLHTQRGMRCSSPMVLVLEQRDREYLLGKWWVPNRTKSQIHRLRGYPHCYTCFSLDGFLVLSSKDSNGFIFFNPINLGKVRIVVPNRLHWTAHVCGIFFNPTLKEYCVLFAIGSWQSGNDSLLPEIIKYKRLNLGSKPSWTEIRIPFSHKALCPRVRPVLIHEYLYWMVYPEEEKMFRVHGDIMEYDINTEVFTLIRYPVPETAYKGEFSLDLLNIDGFPSLVLVAISSCRMDINIWTLRDRTEQLWTNSKYRISGVVYPKLEMPRALAVVDGELLISSSQKLFVYSLKRGTVRKFGKSNYTKGVSFFPHVIGLASLRNCYSKIFMEWEDESTEVGSL